MPRSRRSHRQSDAGPKITPADDQYAEADVSPSNSDVFAVYLSPGGQYLAVATNNNRLIISRLDGDQVGDQLGEWRAQVGPRLAWSESGAFVAFVNADGYAEVVHLPGGESSIMPLPLNALARLLGASVAARQGHQRLAG